MAFLFQVAVRIEPKGRTQPGGEKLGCTLVSASSTKERKESTARTRPVALGCLLPPFPQHLTLLLSHDVSVLQYNLLLNVVRSTGSDGEGQIPPDNHSFLAWFR